MVKTITTKAKYFLLIDHFGMTVEDKPKKIKVRIPMSFLLEDQIFELFALGRLGIHNLESEAELTGTVTPIHYSSRKDMLKAGFIQE